MNTHRRLIHVSGRLLEPEVTVMSVQIQLPEDTGDPGKRLFIIEFEGVRRQFIVYRPVNLSPATKTPLVFMFHGTAQDGEKFYQDSGWREKADSVGLTVVFPTSLKYHIVEDYVSPNGTPVPDLPRHTEKWNFLNLPSMLDPAFPNQPVYDDVAFVRTMLTYVLGDYRIDRRHIYASGFSNGGQFVARLMVEMSNIFAAFSICSAPGTFYTSSAKGGEPLILTPHPRPVMNLIGEKDEKIIQGIGESIPFDESAVAYDTALKRLIINDFLEELRLSDRYTYTPDKRLLTFEYADRLEPGNQVYLLAIGKHMGHVYLNNDRLGTGAADLFWDFMSQYSLGRAERE